MTIRLYEQDAYLRHFEARVLACEAQALHHAIELNQSAFYPEGGGQPGDRGELRADNQAVRVLDTQADHAGRVWHICDGPLPLGGAVRGEIDWARRFDHMQQHLGEHILAGCLWELAQGFTHGLHIGATFSSIDATLPDGATRLAPELLQAIETLANQRVQQDAPVTAWYPGDDKLAALPLRKAPAVQQHVRVVRAGDYEMVACGGTHPSSSGQVGIIKVLGQEPARGKLRLSFLCGMRAVMHYQRLLSAAQGAAALLSSPVEELPQAVGRLKLEQGALVAQVKALERQQLLGRAEGLLRDARQLPDGSRLIVADLPASSREALQALGQALIAQPKVVALLQCQSPAGGYSLLFGRHSDATGDMAALIKASGAKGGGRPDFAQGSAPDDRALSRAEQAHTQALTGGAT